jgi:hypothetical protein
MTLSRTGIVAAAVLGLGALSAHADEITDRINDAKTKYEAGDLAGSAQELSIAVTTIQKAQGDKYAATMPAAPSGWKTESPSVETAAMMGGGVVVKRSYTKDENSESPGQVQVTLTADNPMTQGLMAAFANPMLLASQPNTKISKVNGQDAIVEWRPDDKAGQVTVVIAGRIVLQIEGSNLESADQMTDILKAWDLAALKKAAGIS